MIALLQKLVPEIESWTQAEQERLVMFAKFIESERKGDVYTFSADERTAIDESMAEIDRDEFASQIEIEKILTTIKK